MLTFVLGQARNYHLYKTANYNTDLTWCHYFEYAQSSVCACVSVCVCAHVCVLQQLSPRSGHRTAPSQGALHASPLSLWALFSQSCPLKNESRTPQSLVSLQEHYRNSVTQWGTSKTFFLLCITTTMKHYMMFKKTTLTIESKRIFSGFKSLQKSKRNEKSEHHLK